MDHNSKIIFTNFKMIQLHHYQIKVMTEKNIFIQILINLGSKKKIKTLIKGFNMAKKLFMF